MTLPARRSFLPPPPPPKSYDEHPFIFFLPGLRANFQLNFTPLRHLEQGLLIIFHYTLLTLQCNIAPNTYKTMWEEYSKFGMMLKRHDFNKIKTSSSLECLQTCRDDMRCQSLLNYVISQDMCELNYLTKEA